MLSTGAGVLINLLVVDYAAARPPYHPALKIMRGKHARPQRLRKVSNDLPSCLLLVAMRELVHVQGGQCTSAQISAESFLHRIWSAVMASCYSSLVPSLTPLAHPVPPHTGGNQIGAKFWEAHGLAEREGWSLPGRSIKKKLVGFLGTLVTASCTVERRHRLVLIL